MITALIYTLVFVLAFPTLGYAECAWVLWMWPTSGSGYFWEIREHRDQALAHGAYETKAECKKAEKRIVDSINEATERTKKPARGGPFVTDCLPDTIDPRGPKGAAR